MVLLSAQAESFFVLAEAAEELAKQLRQTGVLQVNVACSSVHIASGLAFLPILDGYEHTVLEVVDIHDSRCL